MTIQEWKIFLRDPENRNRKVTGAQMADIIEALIDVMD